MWALLDRAEEEGVDLFVPTLTYDLEHWVVTERLRS